MYEYEYRFNPSNVFAHEVWQRNPEREVAWVKIAAFLGCGHAMEFCELNQRLSALAE